MANEYRMTHGYIEVLRSMTTPPPTTAPPTSVPPTTVPPTTLAPTTLEPTTEPPPSEIICIVDTDPTQSPDYTSLSAALVGEAGGSPICVTSSNLVANNEQLTIKLRCTTGAADTTPANVTGFTTDATRFVKIIVDTGHKHSGAWSDTKYRIIPSVDSYYAIQLDSEYTEVHGVQGQDDAYDRAVCTFNFTTGNDRGRFVDCIAKNTRYNSTAHQIGFCLRAGADERVINCLAFGFKTSETGGTSYLTAGILSYSTDASTANNAFNCVTYDCQYGFLIDTGATAGKFYVYNCISVDSTDQDFYDNSIGWGTSDKNISSDSSAPGSTVLTGESSTDLFVDASGGDFRARTGSNAIDFGYTCPSNWMDPVDIVGTSRPVGSNWDSGIFEGTGIDATTEPPTTTPPTTEPPTTTPPTTHPPALEYQNVGQGSVPIAGTLVKKTSKSMGDYAVTQAGTLVKKTSKDVGEYSVGPTGALVKKTSKTVGGYSLASTGSLGTQKITEPPTTPPPTSVPPTTLPPTTQPPQGTVVWGQDSGTDEDNVRDFVGNWTGSGLIESSGDGEQLSFQIGNNETSEVWHIGAGRVKITLNKYGSGVGTPTVKYKSGDTIASCLADTWHDYTGSFVQLGFVQIYIEDTA